MNTGVKGTKLQLIQLLRDAGAYVQVAAPKDGLLREIQEALSPYDGAEPAAPFEPKTYLHAFHVSGNLHDAARAVNNLGWSDFLVQIDVVGLNALALLRMPINWPKDARGPLSANQRNGVKP